MENEADELGPATEQGRSYRFGRSPFWLQLTPESYARRSSQSWRAAIVQRPPRTRRLSAELPLIDISPRHPLFTLKAGGESFPLLIDTVGDVRSIGRGIALGGERRIMLRKLHTVTWSAKLRPRSSRAATEIAIDFKISVVPPLPPSCIGDLQIQLFAPMHRAEPWSFPYAPQTHGGAVCLWSAQCGVACSVVLPAALPSESGAEAAWKPAEASGGAALMWTAAAAVRRGRGALTFHLRLDSARTRPHAQFMHLRFCRELLAPALPSQGESGFPAHTLRDRALRALHQLTDKGSYQVVGVERVYVRAGSEGEGAGHAEPPSFTAGFPHFPLDAARAMLDWDRMIGDEVAQRLALLIARGIATDFAVIGGDSERPVINKGAFWDRRVGAPGSQNCSYADYLGDEFHSIASTARIARGLFSVYEHTKDLISYNAAINASQWLILRQSNDGYFDGDRVCALSGATIAHPETAAGIEAIAPLIQAYAATRNEVYVKAASRIARHATSVLMHGLVASPIFQQYFGGACDSPATVATLIRALGALYSHAATRRAHEDLEMAGIWLRAWDLSAPQAYPAMDQDGRCDGVVEVARAALVLLAVDRDPLWFETALKLAMSLPESAHCGWQSLPLFLETMLSVAALVPGAEVDLQRYCVRASWSDFGPDPTTSKYIGVEDAGDAAVPVDHLPLVCRVDGRVLVTVLAHGPADRIRLVQNGREPNLRDLKTGELICQPAGLHRFPFASESRWGVFVIEP